VLDHDEQGRLTVFVTIYTSEESLAALDRLRRDAIRRGVAIPS